LKTKKHDGNALEERDQTAMVFFHVISKWAVQLQTTKMQTNMNLCEMLTLAIRSQQAVWKNSFTVAYSCNALHNILITTEFVQEIQTYQF